MASKKGRIRKYRAVVGSHYTDEEAAVIGPELTRLPDRTPSAVVEAAVPERSPLHKHFEWSNARCGSLYRLEQARHMLRSIEVELVFPNREEAVVTRCFVALRQRDDGEAATEQEYQTIDVALSDRLSRQALMSQALAELASIKRRYAVLQELGKLFEEVDALQERMSA